MKHILLCLSALMFVSCTEKSSVKDPFGAESESRVNSRELDSTSEYEYTRYHIYTLEGCEYIMVNAGSATWGSHKGNCKNPIHYKIK